MLLTGPSYPARREGIRKNRNADAPLSDSRDGILLFLLRLLLFFYRVLFCSFVRALVGGKLIKGKRE